MADFTKYNIEHIPEIEETWNNDKKNAKSWYYEYDKPNTLLGCSHGISPNVYKNHTNDMPTEVDMKAIGKEEALEIFEQYFWNGLKANEYDSQTIANLVFLYSISEIKKPNTDMLWVAAKELQQSINWTIRHYENHNSTKLNIDTLKIDKKIGDVTITTLNSVCSAGLEKMLTERLVYLIKREINKGKGNKNELKTRLKEVLKHSNSIQGN